MKSVFPALSGGGVETEQIGSSQAEHWWGMLIGVTAVRLAAEACLSPPLSRPYQCNHHSSVMGPVQLSALSGRLIRARGTQGCETTGRVNKHPVYLENQEDYLLPFALIQHVNPTRCQWEAAGAVLWQRVIHSDSIFCIYMAQTYSTEVYFI